MRVHPSDRSRIQELPASIRQRRASARCIQVRDAPRGSHLEYLDIVAFARSERAYGSRYGQPRHYASHHTLASGHHHSGGSDEYVVDFSVPRVTLRMTRLSCSSSDRDNTPTYLGGSQLPPAVTRSMARMSLHGGAAADVPPPPPAFRRGVAGGSLYNLASGMHSDGYTLVCNRCIAVCCLSLFIAD